MLQLDSLWHPIFKRARRSRYFWADFTFLRSYWEVTLCGWRLCWWDDDT